MSRLNGPGSPVRKGGGGCHDWPRHHRLLFRIEAVGVVIGLCMVIGALIWHTTQPTPKQAALGPTPLPAHPYTLPATTVGGSPVVASSIAPGHVSIPSLGVTAPLVSESITGNQLGVPSDVHDVGIWSGGGTPSGPQGTVLLAGHVNWWNQGNGALHDLASLQPGATIYVRGSTGTETAWQAVSLHAYLKADLPQTVFAPSGPRRLVLVTCGGAYNPTTGHYADNVVAAAVPVTTALPSGEV